MNKNDYSILLDPEELKKNVVNTLPKNVNVVKELVFDSDNGKVFNSVEEYKKYLDNNNEKKDYFSDKLKTFTIQPYQPLDQKKVIDYVELLESKRNSFLSLVSRFRAILKDTVTLEKREKKQYCNFDSNAINKIHETLNFVSEKQFSLSKNKKRLAAYLHELEKYLLTIYKNIQKTTNMMELVELSLNLYLQQLNYIEAVRYKFKTDRLDGVYHFVLKCQQHIFKYGCYLEHSRRYLAQHSVDVVEEIDTVIDAINSTLDIKAPEKFDLHLEIDEILNTAATCVAKLAVRHNAVEELAERFEVDPANQHLLIPPFCVVENTILALFKSYF